MSQAPAPVFLVGAHRSGTTLLRLLLDRHPDVHWFGEFEYPTQWCEGSEWPHLAAYYKHLEVDRAFRRDGLSIDRDLGYVDLARSFLQQHKDRAPAHTVLGCTVHLNFDRLPEIWPEARYVHLIRDPRDVARSMVALGWAGHPAAAVAGWIHAERTWDRLRAKVPAERVHELHNEQLLSKPEEEMSALCRYLGLAPHPDILTPDPASAYGAPDPGLAEQWKRKMTDRDVRRVEERLGSWLNSRGYEPSGLPPLRAGVLERTWLALRNRWVRARFAVRRYGWLLWIERTLASRVGPGGWRRRVALRLNEIDTRLLR